MGECVSLGSFVCTWAGVEGIYEFPELSLDTFDSLTPLHLAITKSCIPTLKWIECGTGTIQEFDYTMTAVLGLSRINLNKDVSTHACSLVHTCTRQTGHQTNPKSVYDSCKKEP